MRNTGTKDGTKDGAEEKCTDEIEVHCDVQNVRYVAQYRLGRCSFVLTVSIAHCAALNQL